MLHIPTFCDLCSRLYVDNKKGTVCEAFPDGIPSKFLFDGEEHDQPFNQKNDLVFNARIDKKLLSAGFLRSPRLRGEGHIRRFHY